MKSTLRSTVLFAALLLSATAHANSTGIPSWSQSFGDRDADRGRGIATDSVGNIVMVGYFSGVADFAGVNLTSAGATDIVIAKFQPDGTILWAQRFGDVTSDWAFGVAIDADDNIIVSGLFYGDLSVGGALFASAGDSDIFLAKYDLDGNHVWSTSFGSTGSDYGRKPTTDTAGNIYLTGNFSGSVSFGGAAHVAVGAFDIYLAKFDADGVYQWSVAGGDTRADEGMDVAVDADGNVYMAGYFTHSADLGGGTLVSAGWSDMFLAKYDSNGGHLWSLRFGSSEFDYSQSLALSEAGTVYLSGYYSLTVDFGGGPFVSAGGYDLLLAEYDSSGNHLWSKSFGGTAYDDITQIVTAPDGSLLLTGTFGNTIDFGGGDLTSNGLDDIFVARFDAQGNHLWSTSAGGILYDNAYAISSSVQSYVYATGGFQGVADFGNGDHFSSGGRDIYLTRYQLNAAAANILSVEDIGNDEGRAVAIDFARSGHDDVGSAEPIHNYEIYRRDDALPKSGKLEGWTYVGSAPANGADGYSVEAPTLADSTISQGSHDTTFLVRASSASPAIFFDSATALGYSLDNLAPASPQNLLFASNALSWDTSDATDFDYFTIYGANSADFASATLMNYTTVPSADLSASPYTHHYISTTDHSGNESSPSLYEAAIPVSGPPSHHVLSLSNYPNPFNPLTEIKYTLPGSGRVNIAVYDTRGARVATLVDRLDQDEGAYSVVWKGRSDSGVRVASGLYFAQIRHGSSARVRKMILIE